MFCTKCGNPLNDNAKFCPRCGQKTQNQEQELNRNAQPDTYHINCAESVKGAKPHRKKHTARNALLAITATFFVLVRGFIWLGSQGTGSDEPGRLTTAVPAEQSSETDAADTAESSPANPGVQTDGSGTTILVYVVGSDMETKSGRATSDIDEMMGAEFGEELHLIIQTGGADAWQGSSVDGTTIDRNYIQRYRIRSGKKELLANLEQSDMGNAQTLSDFLKWGVDTYPAERYIAVLWNHGGGTTLGYGKDEVYGSMMSLPDIKTAFENSGSHFDMIGFDACLMATFETAYALRGCADYLLASEEFEWGYGWYYTDWLTLLGSNPDISTEEIAKKVIDDYAASIERYNASHDGNRTYTLSLMDLTKTDEVYSVITDCFDEADRRITAGGFHTLSQARLKAAFYGGGGDKDPGGRYAQIDIVDFFTKADLMTDSRSTDLICGENGFVVYEKNNYAGSNGIAMYFPFTPALNDYWGSYDKAAKVLKSIGYEKSYFKFMDSYMAVLADINDMDFAPQYSEKPDETYVGAAVLNNPYTEPVLDEDGWLPIVKDERGYYRIDLSVQPEEFVNNIASIWSSTYVGEGEYLWHIITTPEINEVGHDNYISYGGLSMRPYPYMHMVAGTLTSLNYLCDNNMGETYYVTARVNGEDAAIVIDSHFTKAPNRTTGQVVPVTKVWHYRGYTTSLDEGLPDIRSLRDFQPGDTIRSVYKTIDGAYYESKEAVTFDSVGNLAEVWNYAGWQTTNSSCVVNKVTDTSGRCYYAVAFYPSADGRYADYYYDDSFTTQHKIEGN